MIALLLFVIAVLAAPQLNRSIVALNDSIVNDPKRKSKSSTSTPVNNQNELCRKPNDAFRDATKE